MEYGQIMKLVCLRILLMVFAITAMLWVFSICLGSPNPHLRIAAIRSTLTTFNTALKMFKDDCGRYPATAEGLEALVARPISLPPGKWHKYLDVDRIPLDAWGHAYMYRCPGLHNTNGYDLFSCGADGKSASGGDDPDDINNWNEDSPTTTWDEASEFGELPKAAILGSVFCLAVLALAWRQRRIGESEGNLHGVFGVLWVAASPALLLALEKTIGAKIDDYPGIIAFWVWLVTLLVWVVSGIWRGSPFSRLCALSLLAVIVICWLFSGSIFPKFS
jgi:general secretion pathway protein G